MSAVNGNLSVNGQAKQDVLLDVHDLQMHFPITKGIIFQKQVGAIKAVDGIDFSLYHGETLGLVGESGCGKSTTGRAILFCALSSAVGFGSFTVALRWGKVANMFPAVAMGALLSVATGAVVALALGQALLVPTHDIVVSIGMGVVTLAGGLLLYTAGSRVVPAAQATLLSMTEILLAPVWVWLALGETVSQATATGGAILLVAVLINAFGGRKPRLPARA